MGQTNIHTTLLKNAWFNDENLIDMFNSTIIPSFQNNKFMSGCKNFIQNSKVSPEKLEKFDYSHTENVNKVSSSRLLAKWILH